MFVRFAVATNGPCREITGEALAVRDVGERKGISGIGPAMLETSFGRP
jgi:hypothetical protein